jgi:hypothetical protein
VREHVRLDYTISNDKVYKCKKTPKGYNAGTAPKSEMSKVECYLGKEKGYFKRNCPRAKGTKSKASGDDGMWD